MARRPLLDRADRASTRPQRPEEAPRGPRPSPPTPADPRSAVAAVNGDQAIRITFLTDLNRTAGNAAAQRLIQSALAPIQRFPPDADDAAEGAPTGAGAGSVAGATTGADAVATYMLTNARFTPYERLQEIANGGAPLDRKDPANAVKAAQTALLDIGYSLLRYKDDGKYGDETALAIEQFRADRGVTEGTGLNAPAMAALDKATPPPGQIQEHYLDYGRLFADDRLDVTLAIGYDEGGSHMTDLTEARDWMTRHAMAKEAGPEPPKAEGAAGEGGDKGAEDPARKGISVPEKWTGKRSVTYPAADGTRTTKEITVAITLVPPGSGGKAAFAKGLNESELTLYSGHARRGIGPDFDADKSPYENFVIGVNSALHASGKLTSPSKVEQSHYVISKKNDLEAMKEANAWDPEKYRIWFFAACSSIAYVDELRGGLLPEKMDRHNLDVFGTTQEIPIAAGLTPVFSNLEGILAAETMEQIVRRMQTSSLEAFRKKLEASNLNAAQKAAELKDFSGQMFMREGAGDNPVAPATP